MLHRCSNEWLKIAAHPCWKVQKALDDAGIDYELVKGPYAAANATSLNASAASGSIP